MHLTLLYFNLTSLQIVILQGFYGIMVHAIGEFYGLRPLENISLLYGFLNLTRKFIFRIGLTTGHVTSFYSFSNSYLVLINRLSQSAL